MSKISVSPALMDALNRRRRSAAVPSLDEVRRLYAPPKTFGTPESARMAMDSVFEDAGGYTLLQHSLALGQYGAMASFLGYGALQSIAQNGLIRACIETVADDMTRAFIELSCVGGSASPQEAESTAGGWEDSEALGAKAAPGGARLEDLSAELARLNVQSVLHEAACLAGYFGGCLIFLDTGAAGPELAEPLNLDPVFSREAGRRGFLRGIRAIDPVNVTPGEYNASDPLSPDYYMPRAWWVQGRLVHASRMVRVVCSEAPLLFRPAYNFLGIPQAQILWDYVLHFQENRDSENRLLSKFSTFVFKTAMSDILSGSASDLAQLDARMQILAQGRSNDGVLAIDKDAEDVVKLETPLSGVTDIVRQSLEILAALNRTPAVKLLGISPSGFNATGESDIRNYYDHIRSQQEKVLRPVLKTILDVMQLSLWGEIDSGIGFGFRPLSEEDKNAAETARQAKINGLCALLDRDVISVEEARRVLADDPESCFAGLDPEDVPDDAAGPDDPPGTDGGETGEEDGGVLDDGGEAPERSGKGAEDEDLWRTAKNGKRYQIDAETGEIVKGNLGQKIWNSEQNQNIRRDRMEDAVREIANGSPESTIPNLRNDLERYGGTNNVTIIKGDEKKGLIHIAARHGYSAVAHVLEAVANGEIERFVQGNKTVHIHKDGYRAVLSLEENGKKKTWLLTGFDLPEERQKKRPSGDSGKVSTRHAATHAGPILSRPGMGAENLFEARILQLITQVKEFCLDDEQRRTHEIFQDGEAPGA